MLAFCITSVVAADWDFEPSLKESCPEYDIDISVVLSSSQSDRDWLGRAPNQRPTAAMDGFWPDRDQTLSVDSQEDCQTETVSQVLLVHQLTRPRQAGQLICQTEASPLQAASEDGETNVICQTEMDTVCVGD